MKNGASIAKMKAVQKSMKQETIVKSKWGKFSEWWKNKAEPWLEARFAELNKLLCNIRLPSMKTILVLVVLVYLSNSGALEEMPNVKWMIECSVRLIEVIFGAFRWLVEQVIGMLDSQIVETIDIFGINELLSNFMKHIFGM